MAVVMEAMPETPAVMTEPAVEVLAFEEREQHERGFREMASRGLMAVVGMVSPGYIPSLERLAVVADQTPRPETQRAAGWLCLDAKWYNKVTSRR